MKHSVAVEGVTLSVEERGSGDALLLLHGFTGSADAMAPVAQRLAQSWRVLAVDLLGHGESEAPADGAAYTMERCTAQLVALLEARSACPAHVFGYSMGGRVALALAAHEPRCVRSLAVLGASAGLSDPKAREQRARADAALADRIESEGIDAFARFWAELPLWESQQRHLNPAQRAALHDQRLRNTARGLAHSLRGLGAGTQPPLQGRLASLRGPVWIGHGAEDAKFGAIAADLARALPHASKASIPAAGHAAHLENPEALLGELEAFFARAEHSSRPAESIRAVQGV